MSMPNIPDIRPTINLDIKDSAKMLFNSLALHEMGLSHIVNAEGEKIQYILGTLNNGRNVCSDEEVDTDKILNINKSVDKVLRNILKNQMILQMKMEDTMELYNKISSSDDCIYDQLNEEDTEYYKFDNCYEENVCYQQDDYDKNCIYETAFECFDMENNNYISNDIDEDHESEGISCSPVCFDEWI